MALMTAEYLLKVTRATMACAEHCFLITLDPSGRPQARLMLPFGPEEDLVVWMAASPASRKARELQADPRATLAYDCAGEGAYVTLLGAATVARDRDLCERYWRRRFIRFWPEGPEGDDYALIRFVPDRIELMNDQRGVMPEPTGLRAAALVCQDGAWLLAEA
jgi:general stress protein 26